MIAGLRETHAVALVWALTILALVVGYFTIVTHYQAAIATTITSSQELQAATRADEDTLRLAPQIAKFQRRVQQYLRTFQPREDGGESSARFLKELETSASLRRVGVISFHPLRNEVPDGQSRRPTFDGKQLEANAFDLVLNGHFAAVLKVLDDLPRRNTVVSIDNVEFKQKAPHEASVDATVRGAIYNFAGEMGNGKGEARAKTSR